MIKCWQCGKLNPENFNYCLECGAELQPEASHSAESDFLIEISSKSPSDEKGSEKPDVKIDEASITKESEDPQPAKKEEPQAEKDSGEQPIELSPMDLGDEPVVLSESESDDLLTPIEDDIVIDEPEVQAEEDSEEELDCANCGTPLKPGDKFCSNCGTPIGSTKPQAAGKTMFLHASQEMPANTLKPRAKLTVIDPTGGMGMVYNIMEGENICGRINGLIIVEDSMVSPSHCEFAFEDEGLIIKDLDSLNGVYTKLRGEMEIPSGMVFRIGQQLLKFVSAIEFEEVVKESDDGTVLQGSPTRGIWGKLIRVDSQGQQSSHYLLNKEVTVIGRDQCDISFPEDGFLSSSHIKVSNRDDKFFLTDLGSSNGTFFRIWQPSPLKNNDIVLIGRTLLRVEYT